MHDDMGIDSSLFAELEASFVLLKKLPDTLLVVVEDLVLLLEDVLLRGEHLH